MIYVKSFYVVFIIYLRLLNVECKHLNSHHIFIYKKLGTEICNVHIYRKVIPVTYKTNTACWWSKTTCMIYM